MPDLNNMMEQVQKAYDDCLVNPNNKLDSLAVCKAHSRKIARRLKSKTRKLSPKDTLRYQSALDQIKSKQKHLLRMKKGGSAAICRAESPSDRVKWVNAETAFSSRIRTGVIKNLRHKDPIRFLIDCSSLFKRQIKIVLKTHSSIKVNSVFCGEFVKKKDDQEIYDFKYMNTRNNSVYRDTDLKEWFSKYTQAPISEKLEEFQEKESGWALVRVINLTVNINKFSQLRGSSYIDLPEMIKRKKACVNVKNSDNACFAWSVIAALYPVDKDPQRLGKYPHYSDVLKLKGIHFPITIKQVPRFEKLNDISINIYALKKMEKERYDVISVYLTKQKQSKHVNLLMIQDVYYYDNDDESFGTPVNSNEVPINYHFVWIKHLSRLLSAQVSKHDGKKFFCDRCLNYFHDDKKLDKHTEDCINLNHCKVKMPEGEQQILSFKNYKNKERAPFVIYCDLESILKPVSNRNIYQEHVPAAIGYYVKCSYDDTLSFYRSYRGENCIVWFTKELEQFAEDVETVFLCQYDIDRLTPAQEKDFIEATHCHVCSEPFKDGDKKVRDHFHLASGNNNNGNLTTNYRGPAHDKCNILYTCSRVIPVIFHNLGGYDANFIIKSIALGIDGRMNLLPITKEKYISFTKYIKNSGGTQFRFIDSFRFMSSSLEKLVSNLSPDQLKILKQHFPNDNEFELVNQKGVYPYDYITSFDVFKEENLPSIDAFYNRLESKDCSRENYLHAQLVWSKLNIRNMGEYTDLYLKTDILLLADVFEQFRTSCVDTYELDPANYFTLPGYTWDCMLKHTKIKLELLNDIDKILFLEKGIRGGLSQCSKRRACANNKYLPDFDSDKPEVYIMYWDLNNQYGWGMSNYLPYCDFEWADHDILDDVNILEVPDDADIGYILEVDLEYPEKLHDLHRDLPLCPEHFSPDSKEKKLMGTLRRKDNYVIHYRALKQAINNGLKLTKIHRALQFKQTSWLKQYIEMNTDLRKNAKNAFEKDLFKLMNNAVFGKTMENIRKHSVVKLVSKWEGRYGAEAYISNPRFKSCTIFDENLVAIELNKAEIYFNKPIYVGMSILDIARTSLFDYHYNYMLKIYGDNSRLLYTDTDSLIYEITNIDPYELMKRDCHEYFDTSDYLENNIYNMPRVNKKVIGLMKDENNGRIVTDFIGLRAKLYVTKLLPDQNEMKIKREQMEEDGTKDDTEIILTDEGITKKAKGVKKSVVHNKISFEDYVNCLDNSEEKIITQNLIKSQKHRVSSITQTKIALSPHDNKRFLLKGSYDTLPWGHYSILETE